MNTGIKKEAAIMVERGEKLEDVVLFFYRAGLTITEAMKVLIDLKIMNLREAKAFVSTQPCWREVVVAADVLHKELLQQLPSQKTEQKE